MNILVIGLGSMGKRRIRLLQEMYPQFELYGVDGRADRRNETKETYGVNCLKSIEDAQSTCNIDSAFVCTSPLSHNSIIKECLQNKWNVFTELNLVSDGYQENIALAEKQKCKLFLSSTFLYREEIQYIRQHLDINKKWNYVYHIGQYLPDWHPWENYQEFFIADKRTNGCREIMAIELPWITKTFGDIVKFNVVSDKMTSLCIEYNDNYMIQLIHKNGNKGTLIVDVVSPVAVRRLELYAENNYFQWSGTPDSLLEYSKDYDELRIVNLYEKEEHTKGYKSFVVENAYKNEIKEFIEVVQHNKQQSYGFEEDLKVLDLINFMEESI